MGNMARMNFLQAENQLKTFSQETGGFAWFPQFEGEMPDVFRNVAAFLRHQYSLSYSPTAGAKDGKFHKLKVELGRAPMVVRSPCWTKKARSRNSRSTPARAIKPPKAAWGD